MCASKPKHSNPQVNEYEIYFSIVCADHTPMTNESLAVIDTQLRQFTQKSADLTIH